MAAKKASTMSVVPPPKLFHHVGHLLALAEDVVDLATDRAVRGGEDGDPNAHGNWMRSRRRAPKSQPWWGRYSRSQGIPGRRRLPPGVSTTRRGAAITPSHVLGVAAPAPARGAPGAS